MEANFNRVKNLDTDLEKGKCMSCLYLEREGEVPGSEKCLRFARFVDHVLNERSRDCEYWRIAHGLTT